MEQNECDAALEVDENNVSFILRRGFVSNSPEFGGMRVKAVRERERGAFIAPLVLTLNSILRSFLTPWVSQCALISLNRANISSDPHRR